MTVFEQYVKDHGSVDPGLAAFQSNLANRLSRLLLDDQLSVQDRAAISETTDVLGTECLYEIQLPEYDYIELDDTESPDVLRHGHDPVAEADFHMAYGLHDQAVDLINGALEVEPSRRDLLEKICEIYFVWGRPDEFVEAARRLRFVVGDNLGSSWERIVAMGQQIAADHELFASDVRETFSESLDLFLEDEDESGNAPDRSHGGSESDGPNDTDYAVEHPREVSGSLPYIEEAKVPKRQENWSIRFTDDFMKSVSKLDAKLQGRILKALTKIVKNPVKPNGNTTKPLTGDMDGLWRWRIGDFRLIYDPHIQEKAIVLLFVGARGGVYK